MIGIYSWTTYDSNLSGELNACELKLSFNNEAHLYNLLVEVKLRMFL